MHMFSESVRLFLIIYFGCFEILTISHWFLFRPWRKINADYFALHTLLAKLINRLKKKHPEHGWKTNLVIRSCVVNQLRSQVFSVIRKKIPSCWLHILKVNFTSYMLNRLFRSRSFSNYFSFPDRVRNSGVWLYVLPIPMFRGTAFLHSALYRVCKTLWEKAVRRKNRTWRAKQQGVITSGRKAFGCSFVFSNKIKLN